MKKIMFLCLVMLAAFWLLNINYSLDVEKQEFALSNIFLVSPAYASGGCTAGPDWFADCCQSEDLCQHKNGSKRCVYDKDCADKFN